MFGSCYHYEEAPDILPDGDYNVTIGTPFETVVGGFNVLRFPFTVDGIDYPVVPNYFDLFDCTDPTDPELLKRFNRQASRILDCFNLEGDFGAPYYKSWEGSKGRVRIEKSKAGFANVVRFYKPVIESKKEIKS